MRNFGALLSEADMGFIFPAAGFPGLNLKTTLASLHDQTLNHSPCQSLHSLLEIAAQLYVCKAFVFKFCC